ncbi:RNA exonuclease 4 [Saitozyma sp. JCM 24511]|nr:RNA exonuclease 4 [Saitozyma sp. JCM 24511]
MSKPSAVAGPSSNWASLKAKLGGPSSTRSGEKGKGKGKVMDATSGRRKGFMGIGRFLPTELTEPADSTKTTSEAGPSKASTVQIAAPAHVREEVTFLPSPREEARLHELRMMVAGQGVLNDAKKAIAIDCEMVGLGHLGSESALARVSLVNYHGHILLDTFVQPRERVTDWRTWVSGVRESDLVGAPVFEDVQKQVAELVEGRVVVGHAIENDLKVLLLSHPGPMVRDTQKCKPLRERAKTKRPGLKRLVEMELGLQIQKGSHSSVTDARATMALYRLHKHVWEQQFRPIMAEYKDKTARKGKGKGGAEAGAGAIGMKRNRDDDDEGEAGEDEAEDEAEDEDEGDERGISSGNAKRREGEEFPGGGRKGISSGLGVIIRRNGKPVKGGQPKRGKVISGGGSGGNWWEDSAA